MSMTWNEIRNEVTNLLDQADYKNVRPMLLNLQQMASAQVPSEDVVEGLLRAVKGIQQDAAHGGQSEREIVNRAAGGFVQPAWQVEDVVNVNRDYFKQVYVQFFNVNADKLEEVKNAIEIDIVPVVMTAAEAQELINGEIFDEFGDPLYEQELADLLELLEERKITNSLKRYGQRAQDWQPFNDSNETLHQLITRTLGVMDGYDKPLVPSYLDLRALNTEEQRRDLRQLRRRGCVVVLDTISVRHPVLQRAYRRSLLDAFPETLIVRIAPVDDALKTMQQMIRFPETFVNSEFYQRFRFDLDGKCGEASEAFYFKRWLSEQMPKLVPRTQATGARSYAFNERN